MPKKSPEPPADSPDTFEEAFEKLESVVHEMEAEELPLEKLIENYEAGTRFFQICQERLNEAQGRIELIRKKADGELATEPFDPDAAPADASDTAPAAETSGAAGEETAAKQASLKGDGELF